MAHSRRKFSEAMDNDAPMARHVFEKMQLLYAVERRLEEDHLPPDQILKLRRSESEPVTTLGSYIVLLNILLIHIRCIF